MDEEQARKNRTTPGFLRVALKNPKREEVVEQKIEATATVRDLKARIESEYPDNPQQDLITLVFAGKVLRNDEAILSDVFAGPSSSYDDAVIVHMVVKQPEKRVMASAVMASDETTSLPPPPAVISEGLDVPNDDLNVVVNEVESISVHNTPIQSATSCPPPYSKPSKVSSTATRSSTSMVYDAVLTASYQAALKSIINDKASSHSSDFTFIPAMIPVPRSAINGPVRRPARGGPNRPPSRTGRDGRTDPNEGRLRNNVVLVPRGEHVDDRNEHNNRNIGHDANMVDNNAIENNVRRQYQIRIHINLRMVFQLTVAGFILYQHCPPSRMLILGLFGLFFYMSTTEFGRRLLRRVLQGERIENTREAQHREVRQMAEEASEQVGQDGPGNPDLQHAQEQPPQGIGWLREIQAFFLGFLASLLPAADAGRAPEDAGMAQDVFGGQQQ